MRTLLPIISLLLLAACQSTPGLEADTRYVRLATVVDKHEFSETERKQAQANTADDSGIRFGIGIGIGSGSRHSGMMFGMGGLMEARPPSSDEQPQIARGAIRYTVQVPGSGEKVEVLDYRQYQVGDCVKVLAGHPSEYPRFFELKAGEHCQQASGN